MSAMEIAELILAAIGGKENLLACGICATRLRVIVRDRSEIDRKMLSEIKGVLGSFSKGTSGLELVLGPRLLADVSNGLSKLTGISSTLEELLAVGGEPTGAPLKIQVIAPKVFPESDEDTEQPETREDSEAAELGEMLESMNGENVLPRSLLVINGPNINMLGIREPDIYGSDTYGHLVEVCKAAAEEAGFDSCECLQSNHEGDLVDYIQQAFGTHDAIVINPAAYTHTSVAILDALKAVRIPAVEVHISNVDEREAFRQVSYVRDACIATISGHGIEGYREAIMLLAQHLGI